MRCAPADECEEVPLSRGDWAGEKAAQAICQAVRRLGETLPPHADAVMSALLLGSVDYEQPAVRTSCLSCLAKQLYF